MSALLALAASVLWGTSDFGGGLLSRRLNAAAAVFLSQGFALAGLLVLLPLAHVAGGRYLLAGAGAGLVGSLSLAAFYRALAIAPMSLVAPISAGGAAIPVLAGLVRGEQLSVVQGAGIGIALLGIVLASGPELRSGVAIRRQALGYAVGAGAGFGAAYTLLALAAGGGVYGTLLTQRIGGLLALAPLALRPAIRVLRTVTRPQPGEPADAPAAPSGSWRARSRHPAAGAAGPATRRGAGQPGAAQRAAGPLGALAAVGICDITANGAYAAAASHGNLAVAAVLASLYPVVTALLARGFLAERLRPVQSVGVIAALCGVLLLSA
ncbi:MAG TPA: EamA family transporter [Streptosporangiaceae bacterium]|nr:EamA family transporter [Streptosporangiaceae bacterium]